MFLVNSLPIICAFSYSICYGISFHGLYLVRSLENINPIAQAGLIAYVIHLPMSRISQRSRTVLGWSLNGSAANFNINASQGVRHLVQLQIL